MDLFLRFLLVVCIALQVEGNESMCAGITRGRDFVITFTGNFRSDPSAVEISLIVVAFSDQDTTVTVSSKHDIGGGPYQTTFVLNATDSRRINLPSALILGTTSEYSDKVVEVNADRDVTVYGLNYAPFTTDAFLAIPVNNLGVSYVAMSYNNDGSNDLASLFAVVGVEDDTNVRVVLTAGVTIDGTSYRRGDAFDLTINRHEVVQLVSDSNAEYIGGSVIESEKPVALFTGHLCASTSGSYCDTLSEQVVPVESWSKSYIYTATGSVNDRSVYIIHSYYDNSVVSIPGVGSITLQVGEFWQGELYGSGEITSTEPISVLQLLRTINRAIVDPSIIQVPSEDQFSFIFGFSTPPKSGGDSEGFFNFLNIVVKSNESETILLNGEPILKDFTGSSHRITGTNYDVFTVTVPKGEGVYFVEQSSFVNSSAFSVIVYGYEDDETYGYSAGLFLPSEGRLLNMEPFFLREVGGEQLIVTLPCLENNAIDSEKVFCRFYAGNRVIDVSGFVLDIYTIVCTTPRFQELSYVTVDVSVDDKQTFPFRGNVYVLSQDILPAEVDVFQAEEVAGNIDFTIEKNITLVWNRQEFVAIEYVDIFIQIAEEESDQDHPFTWSEDLDFARNVENVGYFQILPSQIPTVTLNTLKEVGLSSVVITLKAKDIHNRPIFHVLSSPFLKMIESSVCTLWKDVLEVGDFSDLPACPCTSEQAEVDGNFETDENPELDYFHEGASACFRSVVGSGDAGQQCCYGSDGNILVGPPGGGTVDAYAPGSTPVVGTVLHFWYDVLPWMACCKLVDQCEFYYDYRPSDDCSDYQPQRPTIGTGDPHFISLDGKEFTFNGAGEFLLVKSSLHSLRFQARMEAPQGINATVYTAFVLSSDISGTIQIQRSSLNNTLILLDGETVNLYFDGYLIRRHDFRGMRVTINSDVSEVRVRLHNQISVLIRITSEMMSFILQLPDAFKGQTEGLLGNFNDDPDDDFLLPNGSSLSPNLTLAMIHYDFGMQWILEANNTKFTYMPPTDFSTFYHPEFLPNLVVPDINSVSDEIRMVCGDKVTCLYDAVVTNSVSFANDSLQDIESFEVVKEQSVKIISCGYPGKLQNGNINGSVYLVGYKVIVFCNEGFYLVGDSELICLPNGTWSNPLPECKVKSCDSPGEVKNGIIEGDVYDIGATITVSCEVGFTLEGESSLTCLSNTTWSAALPTCASMGLDRNVIIGIIVGGSIFTLVVVFVGVLLCCLCSCKKKKIDEHQWKDKSCENKAFSSNVYN